MVFNIGNRILASTGISRFFPQYSTEYKEVPVTFPQNGLAKFSLGVPAGTTSLTLNVGNCTNCELCTGIVACSERNLLFVCINMSYQVPIAQSQPSGWTSTSCISGPDPTGFSHLSSRLTVSLGLLCQTGPGSNQALATEMTDSACGPDLWPPVTGPVHLSHTCGHLMPYGSCSKTWHGWLFFYRATISDINWQPWVVVMCVWWSSCRLIW